MKKTLKLFAAIFAVALTLTLGAQGVSALAATDKTPTKYADKTITDFTQSAEGFTIGGSAAISSSGVQLIADATVASENEYRSFMAQITLGDIVKGFTLSFGNAENACAVKFDGARVYGTGLTTSSGTSSVTLDDYLSSDAIIQIEVIGGEVSVAVKNADKPYDALGTPAATFIYADGINLSKGKITLSVYDGAICAVKKVNVYSLDPTVEIPTEDYVAPAPKPDNKTDDKADFNVLWVVLPLVGAVVIAAVAVVIVIVVKRKKR